MSNLFQSSKSCSYHINKLSEVEIRKKPEKMVFRVLKPDGLLSVYPEHMEVEVTKREIEEVNFHFEKREKMNKKELIEEIKKIERKVEELKKSVPVHSPKVSMMQELEDLEEKLDAKRKILSRMEN